MSTSRPALLLALALAVAACPELRAPVAPGGRVVTAQGGPVELADLWAERDLVIVFYRGFW